MNIVFMGTPDFAVSALEALLKAGHDIKLVVTQPDKPKGRSGALAFPPVKECALKHGLPVFQPVRIKTAENVEYLRQYEADVYVVAAFGQILSQEILDMPRLGCINIHASLLPKYRGSSPIQRAILDGEEKTGVTIMQMDIGVDTGDMLYKKEYVIKPTDTFESLHDELAVLGGQAIVEALALLKEGKLIPEKQRDEDSCKAPMISKEMGLLNFCDSAAKLDRQIRGLNPWPSAFTKYQGKTLKIWRAVPVEGAGEPGEILLVEKDSFVVACGENALCIYELQLEGKKRMNSHDFLLGQKVRPGERLG